MLFLCQLEQPCKSYIIVTFFTGKLDNAAFCSYNVLCGYNETLVFIFFSEEEFIK